MAMHAGDIHNTTLRLLKEWKENVCEMKRKSQVDVHHVVVVLRKSVFDISFKNNPSAVYENVQTPEFFNDSCCHLPLLLVFRQITVNHNSLTRVLDPNFCERVSVSAHQGNSCSLIEIPISKWSSDSTAWTGDENSFIKVKWQFLYFPLCSVRLICLRIHVWSI